MLSAKIIQIWMNQHHNFWMIKSNVFPNNDSGPLLTKRTDVLPQDLVKARSREIKVWTLPVAMEFDRHPCSRAAEMPVTYLGDTINLTSNPAIMKWIVSLLL